MLKLKIKINKTCPFICKLIRASPVTHAIALLSIGYSILSQQRIEIGLSRCVIISMTDIPAEIGYCFLMIDI